MNSQAVRKIAALSLVVLMSAAGAACGGDDGQKTGGVTPANNTTTNNTTTDAGTDASAADTSGEDATVFDATDAEDGSEDDDMDADGSSSDEGDGFDGGDVEDGGDATLEPRDTEDIPGAEDVDSGSDEPDGGGSVAMEICDNMSFAGGTEEPIDDDGDGDANCEDDECLAEAGAAQGCYDVFDEPNLVPGESYLGVIGPPDGDDYNRDNDASNDVDVDFYDMYPMNIQGKKLEFKVATHNANTLKPCIALTGEGDEEEGQADRAELKTAEGDGVTPVTMTYEFASDAGYGNRIEVRDCRNDAGQDLPSSTPEGGSTYTYTLTVTEL